MKKTVLLFLLLIVSFSNSFSEASSLYQRTIRFDSIKEDNNDTCSLILTTVNDTLQLLFSQLDSFTISHDLKQNTDIIIKTSVKQEKNTFYITATCIYTNNVIKPFTFASNQFEVFQTFSEVDSIAIKLINSISGNNYSIQKLVINNGSLPDNIEVYLNDKRIKNEDLNSILSGSYHLLIRQVNLSGSSTLLDLNPFIIGTESETSLFLPINGINEQAVKLVTNHSYTSKATHTAFPDWNDDWIINDKGQTVIMFHARAMNDIFIGFANTKNQDSIRYEFNAGGWNNTKSVFRRFPRRYIENDGEASVIFSTEYRIKQDNDYWVIFDKNNNTIAFGYGLDYTKNRVLFYRSNKSLSEINYFSFSSWDVPVEYSNIVVTSE